MAKSKKGVPASIPQGVGEQAYASVLGSDAYKKEIAKYQVRFGHIPLMLQSILEEQVALRVFLEGEVGDAK